MKLSQYLNKNKSTPLSVQVDGEEIEDVFFRRLTAGEGYQLKEAVATLVQMASDFVAEGASAEDVSQLGEQAKQRMSPEQIKALFKMQKLFCLLHLGNKDGTRRYPSEKEFDREVPDEFVEAFYVAGSAHKKKVEPEGEAEKNS